MGALLLLLDVAILTLVFSAVFWTVLDRLDPPKKVVALVVGGLGVRYVYAVVDNMTQIFVGRYDFNRYNDTLWAIVEGWRAGSLEVFFATVANDTYHLVYAPVLGPIYVLFGKHPVLVRIAMAFAGALVVVNVYRLTRLLGTRRASIYATAITTAFPYWIYISGLFYRDVLVMLFLSQLLYTTLRWCENDRILTRSLGVAIAAAGLSGGLREENFVAIAALLGSVVFLKLSDRNVWLSAVSFAVAVVGSLSAFTVLFHQKISLNVMKKLRESLTSGEAAYLSELIYQNVWELLTFLPIGTVYFLLVPFPWQVHNFLALLGLLQNVLFWYPVLLAAAAGLPRLFMTRPGQTFALVMFSTVGIFAYGAIEGNVGPAVRHRSQFQLVFVVFAAITVDAWSSDIDEVTDGTIAFTAAGSASRNEST